MSKKAKKRKRKKSSSSSEEDGKSSKEKDVAKNCKSGKRKPDVKESAAKKEKCVSPTVKDDSQSTRQIKNPVYRLSKTRATDQKPVNKEERRKPDSVVVPLHCSSKAKHDISGTANSVSGSKTVEKGPSTPSKNAGAAPQRTEETSKSRLDKKSSQRSSSTIKKQRISPSLVSPEQKQDRLKRNCRAEEPPRTGNDSNAVKTREPSKPSSVSVDSSWQKRAELFEKMCQRHEENKAKKSPSREAKTHSASSTKHSSSSAKQAASASSSKLVKNVTTIPGKFIPMPYKTVKSSSAQQQICPLASPLSLKFKIQKKVQPRPVDSPSEKNDVKSTHGNLKHGTELSDSGASKSNSKEETVQQASTCLDVTPSFSSEEQSKRSSLSDQLPSMSHSDTEPQYDQMPVVEELHLARSAKRLEMNVMQSYGELTCMDIDPPEGAADTADTHSQQPLQQNLILVLDTNILLSHLDYVKQMQYHSLVLIPWVVLQELDCLKSRRGMPGSVAHLAIPAISYIYNCLKSRECHLRGQSMEQAAESIYGLNAENNDDRVLQCCLQYQSLYPECALILCTDDKNLCCKALVSGVRALSKRDLEAEIGRSRHGFHPPQNIKPPILPHIDPHVSLPVQSRRYEAVQPRCGERTSLFVEEKDNKQLSTTEDEEETKWDNSSVSELEDCLRDVLSDVLEVEMKAAYDELWLEIVYLKPPWTLQDVLQCFKKHWFAVFGHVVPRWMEQTVTKLIDFFSPGKTADSSATSAAFQEAKELVKAFRKSSTLVPSAITIMDNIYNKLQPQSESPAGDVVMNDKDEDKQPTSSQVSHQEVWAVFENIWSYVFQLSLEVFRALGFDPHNMQSAQPVGGPPPPQDAVDCLHKLSSVVSQLIQAFSSVLSSPPGSEEVQTLLGIIHTTKVVDVDSRVTAKDFLDCFSQQDYREKLRVGGNQLMELKEALDRCAGTTGQYPTFTTLP